MASKFVHLHSHSHYSLLQALPRIKELIQHVKGMGMDTVALTDLGSMYGAIEFYQKANDAGVKPIIGMDASVARTSRHSKRARIDTKPWGLVLLAENQAGYRNLMQLTSVGFLEGFYYKPRIDKELLRIHHEGLIALSGGHFSEINEALRNHNPEAAEKTILEYAEIFGPGNFFLELVDRPEIAEQETVNAELIELGKKHDIPVVATKDTFYIRPSDVEAWKVLNCIKSNRTLERWDRLNQFDYDASMVTGEYMEDRFSDIPEAIENTRKIADRCNLTIELGKWNFPKFEIPAGKTFREVLTERAFEGAERKFDQVNDEVIDRMNYELEIIENKGFSAYFLIVSDFLSWAKEQRIVTTTRGSAAGSLVAYCTDISGIDPLHYQLPFERFLNPERPSAPDVDADFADNRRDEVLDYVREKYGHDKVAQICTFGSMLARGSVRDVGRALGYDYDFVDGIARLVPMGSQGFAMTLDRALDESPDLKKRYNTEAQVRRAIDVAKQIEGCSRHVSVHAAGTVISPTALEDFTPLQIDTRAGKVITQYEMKSVEAAGLVKMDFLGIRNLSILGDAMDLVKKTKGVEHEIESLPVDDKKTFELLAKGNTMGVFQLSGDGMTKYLMELKPERIEDIMAMVALYRPGPIESIPEYIKRRFDPKKTSFMDPRMEEFLQKSYGLLVYQDDVMLTAIKLAGYSWLEADKLRKAMGKKIPEEMAKQKIKLLKGFVDHGLSEKKGMEIWKLIEPFAAYGFNKAHAASYGMIAYATAYMKANYPSEYMTALMTAESADLEKISFAVKECSRMGIEVLPPHINESRKDFTYIDDQNIRFGLLAIKNLGAEVIESIIAERKKNGPFVDLVDFAGRVGHRAFNKKSLEALTKAGALDSIGERKQLLENMDRILLFNKGARLEREQNQSSLFDLAPTVMNQKISLREVPSATTRERLSWEKELVGLYVSAHPWEEFGIYADKYLVACEKVGQMKEGEFVKCGGVITTVKEIMTKKGDPMAFVGLEDTSGRTEMIIFPKIYAKQKHKLIEDTLVLVSSRIGRRDGEEGKLLANDIIVIDNDDGKEIGHMLQDGMWIERKISNTTEKEEIETISIPELPENSLVSFAVPETESNQPNGLSIALRGKPTPEMIQRLREIFKASPGRDPVFFLVESGGQMRKVVTDYTVDLNNQLLDKVAAVVGRQNVV